MFEILVEFRVYWLDRCINTDCVPTSADVCEMDGVGCSGSIRAYKGFFRQCVVMLCGEGGGWCI